MSDDNGNGMMVKMVFLNGDHNGDANDVITIATFSHCTLISLNTNYASFS